MKNFKILSLFLILILITSPTMLVDGKAFAIDLEQQTIFENKQIIEQKTKYNFITLTESISVQTDEQKKNSESQNVGRILLELRDKVSVSDISVGDSVIIMIKANDDRKTMMERIFEGSRLHRVIFDSASYSVENSISLASFTNNPQSEYSYHNLELEIDQRLGTFLIDYLISERQLETSYENPDRILGQLVVSTNSLLDAHVIPLPISLIYSMSFFVLGGSFVIF